MKTFLILLALTPAIFTPLCNAYSEEESSVETSALSASYEDVVDFKETLMGISDALGCKALSLSQSTKPTKKQLNRFIEELNSIIEDEDHLKDIIHAEKPLHNVLFQALDNVKIRTRNADISDLKQLCFDVVEYDYPSTHTNVLTRDGGFLKFELANLYDQIKLRSCSMPATQQRKFTPILKEIELKLDSNEYLNSTAKSENPLHIALTEATEEAEKIVLNSPTNKNSKTTARTSYLAAKNLCFEILLNIQSKK